MTRHKTLFALVLLPLLTAGAAAALIRRDAATEMSRAAQAFIGSLSDEQKTAAVLSFDDAARLDWHFIPKPTRKGMQIKDMKQDQRKLAHAILAGGLSKLGYDKAAAIMGLEAILRELEKKRTDGPIRDPERYYFTLFGEPAPDHEWGVSIEGHHLSLNFVCRDGQVAAHTPAFFGANPAEVKTAIANSPPAGTRILAEEEDLAFDLLKALTPQQRKRAVIAVEAPADLRGAAEPHPADTAPEGLPSEEMSPQQLEKLKALIGVYTANMLPEVAEARWAEIDGAGLNKIYFAWAGADRPGVGHYYRVQGPTFLIELVNTQPDAEGNVANHIHSYWRQMAGDFGLPR